MQQKTCQKFTSDCGRANIIIENEMPVGEIHDFLMMIKGHMVDIMIKAHKEEQEAAKAQMQNNEQCSS